MDKKVNVWADVKAYEIINDIIKFKEHTERICREQKEVVCLNCNEKIKYRLSNVMYKTISNKIYKIKELVAYIHCYNCHKDIILKGEIK